MPPTPIPALSPSDFGLPAKFASWRTNQWEAINRASLSSAKYIICVMPTGVGKSVFAYVTATLEGGRFVYNTSTKPLQQQLIKDFSSCGLVDIRGRANYRCRKGTDTTCADGRLMDCKDMLCPYQQARQRFLESNLGSTNYAYLLASTMHSEGVGQVSTMIFDEAHSVIDELCSVLEIRIRHDSYSEIYQLCETPTPDSSLGMPTLKAWATRLSPRVKRLLESCKSGGISKRHLSKLNTLGGNLDRLIAADETWIIDEYITGELIVSPLWPTDYAQEYLFKGVPRILLMSATIVPKTLELLAIPAEESITISLDDTFDPKLSPVYMFGAHRIDHRTTESEWQETMGRMDTIIKKRLDRKGIIHPVSYDRTQRIMKDSEYRDIMIAPNSSNFQQKLKEYLDSPPPRIFISPAATTGYDFPYEDAEYQIIIKLPRPDARSPIMKARSEKDPEYVPYLIAQTLTQMCGRARRAADDHCENFILDQHAEWFTKPKGTGRWKGGYAHLFPGWFIRQIVYPAGLPSPPVSFFDEPPEGRS